MSIKVKVECPVCGDDLPADVTLIDDSEGEGPPYGPVGGYHSFTALDDYTVDWNGHYGCQGVIDTAGDVTYNGAGFYHRKLVLLDALEQALTDAAVAESEAQRNEGRY